MRKLAAALLVASTPLVSLAQGQTSGPVLTLEEAITLALRNNPTHLQQTSARGRAGTALRSAYGNLLPSVNSSFGTSFREGGSSLVEGQQFGSSSDQLGTSYSVSVSAGYSLGSVMGPRQARANLEASEADVRRSEAALRASIVTQYLNVLQAQARAALQDTLLINAQSQLELNRARQQVGAATTLEVRRSEVQVGRAQVNVLRERNAVEIETLRLFQQIGVDHPEGARLVTSFPVSEPSLQLNELLDMARRGNPALNAARSREQAANVGVTVARSQWLPSIGFSTSFNGYTAKQTNIDPLIAQAQFSTLASRASCFTNDSIRVGAGLAPSGRNCSAIDFTDADAAAIRAQNDKYPFSFTKQPFNYSIGLSLPIFNGFQREQRIQDAQLSRNDARYALRAQELQINTEVTSAYRNLLTQYRTVRLQEQNRQAAEEALQLALERYRVGANTFIDVTQARGEFETAGTDLINAIYDFHKAYAELERAVGRPLR